MFGDIFEEIRKLQREINRSFGNFWDRDAIRVIPDYSEKNPLMRSPLTDLEERDKEIIIRFEIPGVNKKDIKLDITSNQIKVRAEKKQETKVERDDFYKQERSYKGFYRVLSLPEKVTPEKAKAKYKDGILEIVIPKTKTKEKNKIQIE